MTRLRVVDPKDDPLQLKKADRVSVLSERLGVEYTLLEGIIPLVTKQDVFALVDRGLFAHSPLVKDSKIALNRIVAASVVCTEFLSRASDLHTISEAKMAQAANSVDLYLLRGVRYKELVDILIRSQCMAFDFPYWLDAESRDELANYLTDRNIPLNEALKIPVEIASSAEKLAEALDFLCGPDKVVYGFYNFRRRVVLHNTEFHIAAIASLAPPELRETAAEGLRAVLKAAQEKDVRSIVELIARTKDEATASGSERPYRYAPGAPTPIPRSMKHVADLTPAEREARREKERLKKARQRRSQSRAP